MIFNHRAQYAKPSRWRKVLKGFSVGAILVLVFIGGVGVGSGKLKLSGGTDKQNLNAKLPENLDYLAVEEVYDALRLNFDGQLDQEKLVDGLKEGLSRASEDPYTEYLNAEASKDFDEQLNGSFEGIGAELSREAKNIVIVSPIAGFPAELAGLKPGDIIAQINDENAYDLTVSQAVKKIRGPKGTSVKLTIVRGDGVLNFEITRATITIPSVTSDVLAGNIGYLKISRFGDDTAKLTREAAESFKNKNIKGVILDLRGDPGGLLEASVDVASLWLKNQTVLEEKRGGVIIKSYTSRGTSILADIPTIVLIDGGSASASEIVAGALKDHKVAKIYGTKSFGKGSVQELRRLKGGGVLKVTIARWYTPSGRNIDKDGIEPDKVIEISEDDLKAKRDPQKDSAYDQLR